MGNGLTDHADLFDTADLLAQSRQAVDADVAAVLRAQRVVATPGAVEGTEEDVRHRRDRDREEGSEDPAELRAHEQRRQGHQRMQLGDPPVHPRSDDVGVEGVPGPQDDELMAIPRLAEAIGVTPRVLRYWEEQGLISPTREHGKLRYSPRDMAIARLTKRLLDAGMSVDGLGMIKELAQREIRWAAAAAADKVLSEQALRLLYQRKAFRETTGMDEEHYPEGRPPRPPHGPEGPEGLGPKPRGPRVHAHIPKAER